MPGFMSGYKNAPKYVRGKGYVKTQRYKTSRQQYKNAMKTMNLIAEKKYLPVDLTGGIDNNNPYLVNLSAVPPGPNPQEREGNKIQPTSLRVNLIVELNNGLIPGTDPQSDIVRVIILQWDEDESGNPFSVTKPLSNSATPFNVTSAYSQVAKGTFKILYDKTKNIDFSSKREAEFRTLIPSKKLKAVKFDDGNLKVGQIFMVVYSKNGITGKQNRITYSSMLRYTDF